MRKPNADCIICGSTLNFPQNVEVSEIITCSECHTRLVVEKIGAEGIIVNKAPDVEEDWGE